MGSSPLTRGKPIKTLALREVSRLIPAHAGKTLVGTRLEDSFEAHPRSRGENTAELTPLEIDDGSSPLTRGKRNERRVLPRARRLIPAHAGKTLGLDRAEHRAEAHPRSRGENTS